MALETYFCLPEEHPQWNSIFAFEISKEVTDLDCGQDGKLLTTPTSLVTLSEAVSALLDCSGQ